MEAVSGIANIFSTLSLALQIGHSALEVKAFLDRVSNASSEISRLSDLVVRLHGITNEIRTTYHDPQNSYDKDNLAVGNIYCALKTCEDSLNAIKRTLKKGSNTKQNHIGALRTLAQFRMVCNRQRIVEFERQLQQSISLLSIVLIRDLGQAITAIRSDIAELTNQELETQRQVISIAHDISHRLYEPNPRVVAAAGYSKSSLAKASIHGTWFHGSRFMVQYCQSFGKNQEFSVKLQKRISKSYMIVASFTIPFGSVKWSIPFCFSIRNLVPDNAPIIEACRRGDSNLVKQLLTSGEARPNDITSINDTALTIAIEEGYEELVQLLLRTGADPNLPCGQFQTSPLQVAVMSGNFGMIRILMRCGADIDYISARGCSILHYLFDPDRSISSTFFFAAFGDNLWFDNTKDLEGWTSLHRCAAYGTAEDVHYLRLLGASRWAEQYTTKYGWTPVHIAAFMNNVSTLAALTELDKSQQQPKQLSIHDLDVLHSVDSDGWTSLHLAVRNGAKDTTKWLLQKEADPHLTTYSTADWFPEGHEGEAFDVTDLAKLSGKEFFEEYVRFLNEVGYNITVDGEEIYWSERDI